MKVLLYTEAMNLLGKSGVGSPATLPARRENREFLWYIMRTAQWRILKIPIFAQMRSHRCLKSGCAPAIAQEIV